MTAPSLQTGPHQPQAAARRRFALTVLRLAILYAVALAVGAAIIFSRHTLPERAQIIAHAVFTPEESVDQPPELLKLPHRCRLANDAAGCSGAYRMTFNHDAAAAAEPTSIYAPTFHGRLILSLNGVTLIDSRSFQTGAVLNQVGPLITLAPASVLRRGENVLDVKLEAWDRTGVFLDPIAVGPDSVVRPAYAERELVLGTLPRLLVAWQAALCLSLLIVWIGRREERIYLAMSVVLGFGVLQGLPLFLVGLDWSDWTLRLANLAGLWQTSLLPGIMARLVGRPLGASNRLLLLVPIAFTAGYLVMTIDPETLQPWFSAAWMTLGVPWVMALLAWAVGVVIVAAFRRGHAPAQFIFGGLIIVIMMVGHDVMAFTNPASNPPPLLNRFVGPLLMTVASATLMWRFAMALTEVSRFNEVLRREITAAEAALRASFEREQAQNRASALESERLRLTRDLHDGLAGQLMSIVAQCELSTRDYRNIGAAARRALDDLRLVIASLDDVGNDLGMMLAQFHERIGPQLQAQGIELDWRMAPLPDIEGLRSEHALSLFRILQEAVTNAVRHSGCRQIAISMAPAPANRPDHAVRIVVSDQGRGGFADRPGGHGLGNMRRRAAAMGAAFAVEIDAGGCRVILDLPRALPDISRSTAI